MARELSKRVIKIFLLISFKEIYLACRNFLGLFYHPFKTLKKIDRENDKIQDFFIFGLPFYFWATAILTVLMARFFLGVRLFPMGYLAKIAILAISLFCGFFFSYLFYWTIFYLQKRREK